MKLLVDGCVSRLALEDIRAAGHDAEWVRDWPSDPGDDEILARARAERRVLVTMDKDFGELAVLRGAPHCGIIRLSGIRARFQGAMLLSVLAHHAEELSDGALATIEPRRVRLRLPR